MPKLTLIHPASMSSMFGQVVKNWCMPCLSLAQVAALTPTHWNVKIVDEYNKKVDFEEKVDLVGITAYTSTASRAYELGAEFRKRNIPVVMGGIHVSMLPDEAGVFADAVVVGEAESVWGELLSDFEKGKMKKIYRGERLPLNNLPIARRDLFGNFGGWDVIQTARGCPFDCDFCSVKLFSGPEYRHRPIDEVLDEMETLKKRFFFILDDNLLGSGRKGRERAIQLFKGMIDRKINKIWAAQAPLYAVEYPEVLKYAHKSGCRYLHVGIESINKETLEEMNKGVNLRRETDGIKKAIKEFHRHGIAISGSFIFGNDHDDVSTFKRTLNFINETELDAWKFTFLTPYPGTNLYKRFVEEDRLIYKNFPVDWEKYIWNIFVFRPKNISTTDLVRGFDYLLVKTLSIRSITLRFFKTLLNTRSFSASSIAYLANMSYRNAFYKGMRKIAGRTHLQTDT